MARLPPACVIWKINAAALGARHESRTGRRMWGRMASCGGLPTRQPAGSTRQLADYQSAAGCHPAPQERPTMRTAYARAPACFRLDCPGVHSHVAHPAAFISAALMMPSAILNGSLGCTLDHRTVSSYPRSSVFIGGHCFGFFRGSIPPYLCSSRFSGSPGSSSNWVDEAGPKSS